MADASPSDIAGYAQYLKAQGASDSDIHGYTEYLSGQHGIDHSPGIIDQAIGAISSGASAIGKKVDSYGSAPIRAAVSSAQNGENPLTAFKNQFGEDPDKAPSYHDIMVKAGVSDKQALSMTGAQKKAWVEKYGTPLDQQEARSGKKYEDVVSPSPASVLGAGLGLVADPVNLIPFLGEAAKAIPGAEAVGEAIAKLPGAAKEALASKLKGVAESSAVNATGATGAQASKFAPNAGRELLDRGIVGFGNNQKEIAKKAAAAVEEANSHIDTALNTLQEKGVKVDASNIAKQLETKITELRKDPAQAAVANRLEGEIQNINNAVEANGGKDFDITAAEQTKRGYNKQAGNWMDPEKGQAGKTLYQAYRGAVEDAAKAADPQTAKLFIEGKKSHGLLTPIQEASERRALTQSQGSHGSLTDLVAAEVGEKALGPIGLIMPLVRRVIGPRIGSSIAVTADKAADLLRGIPEIADLETKNPTLFSNLAKNLANTSLESKASSAADKDKPQPKGGYEKWANDGLKKLIDHSGDKSLTDQRSSLMDNPKTKQLLIAASDLKVGSKAMDDVLSKLKSRIGRDEK